VRKWPPGHLGRPRPLDPSIPPPPVRLTFSQLRKDEILMLFWRKVGGQVLHLDIALLDKADRSGGMTVALFAV
jgi:hypothetical protein